MEISELKERIVHLNDKIKLLESLKFNYFDKIILSAEKSRFRKLNPNIKKRLKNHPDSKNGIITLILNKGNVVRREFNYLLPSSIQYYKSLGYSIKEIIYRKRKFQKIKYGTIEFECNSIKLVLNGLDNYKDIKKQVKEVIKYLIEKQYIQAVSSKNHILNYYLKKFNFNEVELNAFYSDKVLYDIEKEMYGYLDDDETHCLLTDFGCRILDENKRIYASVEHQVLNIWDMSCYIWTNNSSKLFIYNIDAKKEKRDYYKTGDRFKIELCIKNMYFKNNKIKRDFNLNDNVHIHNLLIKVQDAIRKPVKHKIARYEILEKMNKRITDKGLL